MNCQLGFWSHMQVNQCLTYVSKRQLNHACLAIVLLLCWELKLWTMWSVRVYWLLKQVKAWSFKVNSGVLLPLIGYRRLSVSIKSLWYGTQERVSWDVQSTSRKEYAYSLFTRDMKLLEDSSICCNWSWHPIACWDAPNNWLCLNLCVKRPKHNEEYMTQ
jgi:hypothetical protein